VDVDRYTALLDRIQHLDDSLDARKDHREGAIPIENL
jgi:hypothetical protein